jgi:hypothetical protein
MRHWSFSRFSNPAGARPTAGRTGTAGVAGFCASSAFFAAGAGVRGGARSAETHADNKDSIANETMPLRLTPWMRFSQALNLLAMQK